VSLPSLLSSCHCMPNFASEVQPRQVISHVCIWHRHIGRCYGVVASHIAVIGQGTCVVVCK
jgi:hypothetical protein